MGTPRFCAGEPLLERAFAYAEQAHRGQLRKDGVAFICHPRRVAGLLAAHGYPPQIVAAGLLHDVVEDTDRSLAEIEAEFGPEVAQLVEVLTEDHTLGYVERKAAHRDAVRAAGPAAEAVFAADVLSNAADLRAAYRRLGAALAARFHVPLDGQVERIAAELAMLRARRTPPPFLDQLSSELDGLRAAIRA
jgi:(p)ppGpp synthase/HD superfamily hydrolase